MGKPDYSRAFRDGVVAEFTIQEGTDAETVEQSRLHLHAAGELVVTSGRIVACDPLAMPETLPLADTVPPGRYPVVLSVAELPSGDQRVAYAQVRLGAQSVLRWEAAASQEQSPSALKWRRVFGYGVDAGTGCFMDADASRVLAAPKIRTATGQFERDTSDELLDLLNKAEIHTWSWANLVTDEASGANVVAFSSGWGDGFYLSYWGYDAAGQRVALVTDFGVLDESWLAHGAE